MRLKRLVCAQSSTMGVLLRDRPLRTGVFVHLSALASLGYAVFRGALGLCLASNWMLACAAYQILLGLMRLRLGGVLAGRRCGAPEGRERRCGAETAAALLLISVPMGFMTSMLIYSEPVAAYPGLTIYVSATYTFFMLSLAISNAIRCRRSGSPALGAVRTPSLAASAVSILELQNAMIMSFSPGDPAYRRLMNTLTGTGVFIFIIAMAARMLARELRRRKEKGT